MNIVELLSHLDINGFQNIYNSLKNTGTFNLIQDDDKCTRNVLISKLSRNTKVNNSYTEND